MLLMKFLHMESAIVAQSFDEQHGQTEYSIPQTEPQLVAF